MPGLKTNVRNCHRHKFVHNSLDPASNRYCFTGKPTHGHGPRKMFQIRDSSAFACSRMVNKLKTANIKKASNVQAGTVNPRNIPSICEHSPVPVSISLMVSVNGKCRNTYSSPGLHSGTWSGGKCCSQTCRAEMPAPISAETAAPSA